MFAIEVKNLNKTYAATKKAGPKIALNNIDLKIKKGSFFALLGPNGAGKSTLINILAGTVKKDNGQVKISDINIDEDAAFARSKIGVVPQELLLDTFFTVRELLEIHAGYYGIRPENRKTDELMQSLGLYDKRNSLSRTLSGGMKRRLLVAKAMVHSPEVLILDEPTAGVDIELREQLWQYVKKINQQGVTIILTTHYLEEAEQLCDEIAFINHGRIVAQDNKRNLLDSLGFKELIIDTNQDVKEIPPSLKKYKIEKEQHKFKISYCTKTTKLSDLLNDVIAAGFDINDLNIRQGDLEDVFKSIMHAS